ncbi:4Fe-4S binding protein [Deferribacterales bacterium Es71-Z0220]|jgi:heterodisulfide reductase subunit A|uniref:4Fe-4S binding protein n=1 Tax=Deferrivibrio essentukiensis TaxID=2880922 RepID=UPI001F616B28|nr:4Fe-4S binding protein [Deferrivibrio essentukiensis]MCB4205525.1 4Fe-4S binding protein [Deferrivibrio essentukiensis]
MVDNKLSLNISRCTGCGACIGKCPFSALAMSYNNGEFKNIKKVVFNADKCNGCGACINFCRFGALFIK